MNMNMLIEGNNENFPVTKNEKIEIFTLLVVVIFSGVAITTVAVGFFK